LISLCEVQRLNNQTIGLQKWRYCEACHTEHGSPRTRAGANKVSDDAMPLQIMDLLHDITAKTVGSTSQQIFDRRPDLRADQSALQAAKACGRVLSNPRLAEASAKARAVTAGAAKRFAENLMPAIREIKAAGCQQHCYRGETK